MQPPRIRSMPENAQPASVYLAKRLSGSMMQLLIVGSLAAVAGIIVGFWVRNTSANAQKALLDQSNRDLGDALNASRAESAQRTAEILELTRLSSKLESDLANERANGERL